MAHALENSCSRPSTVERQAKRGSPKKNPYSCLCRQDFLEQAHEHRLRSQVLQGSTHWQMRQVRGSRSWHYGRSRGLVDDFPTLHLPSMQIAVARLQPPRRASVSRTGGQRAALWKRNGSSGRGGHGARRYSPWQKPTCPSPRLPNTRLAVQGLKLHCPVVALVP